MGGGATPTLSVIGVPSGAGAYSAGLELAPAALRDAGLLDALAGAGWQVHDAGDLTRFVWRPDRAHPRAQHASEVAREVREVAATGGALLRAGHRLLVLGGSCTVALGTGAAMRAAAIPPRLVYLDRHLDLNTPESTAEGAFGWMGMAHALALPGAAPEVVGALGDAALLTPEALSYLGVDIAEATDGERAALQRLAMPSVSLDELVRDPAAAARRAQAALGPGPFAIHVDVDVLDFIDAPLAENVNGRNSGPTVGQVQQALAELWRHPDCRAVSVGQLHPPHAAGDPDAIPRFVAALAAALRAPDAPVHESESPSEPVVTSTVDLIGLRFDGYGRPGNQTGAAEALRTAGIAQHPAGPLTYLGDVVPPGQSGARGPSGLVNEPALTFIVRDLAGRVDRSIRAGRFPLVVGGDCSALLGSMSGARAALGECGLLHVDGHEDTTPIDASEDGEAANSEIGMLLGITGRTVHGELADVVGALRRDALALLGQRDDGWRRDLNLGSLEALGVWKRGLARVAADPSAAGRAAAAHVRRAAPGWWLHVDVDVLDPDEFPAQGLPDFPDEPGGLDRAQLLALVEAAVEAGGCVGASIAIYDPDQDPDGSGARFVVELAHGVVASLGGARAWRSD